MSKLELVKMEDAAASLQQTVQGNINSQDGFKQSLVTLRDVSQELNGALSRLCAVIDESKASMQKVEGMCGETIRIAHDALVRHLYTNQTEGATKH